MNKGRMLAIARHELSQFVRSWDYLLPLGLLAALFFVVIPGILLGVISNLTGNETAQAIGAVIDTLPEIAKENVRGDTVETQAAYALAVFLLAPIAIVVPLTISTAVGAGAVVGERERGTGEFLAHSPATEREIYLGKLTASLVPGYVATVVGFGVYAVVVNSIVGPDVGGWFFPTTGWWILIFWVVPPFLAVALSVIVALSASVRSVTAAQQASQLVTLPVILIAYGLSTGLMFDEVVAGFTVGGLAWVAALVGLYRGTRSVRRESLLGVE